MERVGGSPHGDRGHLRLDGHALAVRNVAQLREDSPHYLAEVRARQRVALAYSCGLQQVLDVAPEPLGLAD